MRLKRLLAVSATVGLMLSVTSQAPILAQPPSGPHVESQVSRLENIRAAIIQATGVRGKTVEVAIAGNILKISRIDNSMKSNRPCRKK